MKNSVGLNFSLVSTTTTIASSSFGSSTATMSNQISTDKPIEQGSPLPGPVQRTEANKIFERGLKWSILEAPSAAEVMSLDAEDKVRWTSILSHPVADEPATDPPLSRISICIEPLNAWEYWPQSGKEPPESKVVENLDGSPITVQQLMQAVHDYAVPLRRLLCRSCYIHGPETAARARFYFLRLFVVESTPEFPITDVSVDVHEDTDRDGRTLAEHLEEIEADYRRQLAFNT
jgi:hypothetical protein